MRFSQSKGQLALVAMILAASFAHTGLSAMAATTVAKPAAKPVAKVNTPSKTATQKATAAPAKAVAKKPTILKPLPSPVVSVSTEPSFLDWLANQQTARQTINLSGQSLLSMLDARANQPLAQLSLLLAARQHLTPAQQMAVLPVLKARVDAKNSQPSQWMTFGFAKVALERSKTGLFFLRKANDELQTPASELAYAMAQADMELSLEKGNPNEVTVRKLDVAYLLNQAVKQDAAKHEPGFWPLFADTVSQLRTMQGYSSLLSKDYSQLYVPMGNRMAVTVPTTTVNQYLASLNGASKSPRKIADAASSAATPKRPWRWWWQKAEPVDTAAAPSSVTASNGASTTPSSTEIVMGSSVSSTGGKVLDTKYVQLSPDPGQWIGVQYSVPASELPLGIVPPKQLEALVLNKNNQPLGRITVPDQSSLAEDLDRDGQFELVVRQFSKVPQYPVRVFRITPTGMVEDSRYTQLFR
jgi:hypothetical protein